MSPYRILIVDDQIDVRRMLRAGLETLGLELHIMDMPSAEEALLELSRQPVHLLISDIRLPGISGLELVVKARRIIQDLKIILITALNDSHTRRLVTESGVYAFFTKPIDMTDFLDKVERALGIVPSIAQSTVKPEPITPVPSISEQLTSLRRSLAAIAVILLSDQGKELAQAGDVLEISGLIPVLLTALSASAKVSLHLGIRPPSNLLWIEGKDYNLSITHVGPSHALLVILPPQEERVSAIADAVVNAARGLLACLASLGAAQAATEHELDEPADILAPLENPNQETEVTEPGEDISDVEAIFQKPLKRKYATRDLNNFWETAAMQSDPNHIGDAGVISYEQAKKLGLTPKDKP